jgi:cobalt-zinc-cadmium efflux system protein
MSYAGSVTGRSADAPPPKPDSGASAQRLARRSRRLLLVLVINVVIVAGQVIAGVLASSVSLMADAAHNLTDVAAILLAFVALRLTRRPPDSSRSFGYHRSTVLAAQANAAFLLAVTAIIGYEAVERLLHPHPVRGGLVALVALGALVANGLAAMLLLERPGAAGGGHDLNMRAVYLHMAADAGASAGVAIAGTVILVTGGLSWLDPLVSLAIAALIGVRSFVLVRDAVDVLLESTPSGLDVADLIETMTTIAGVEDVHDVHVWSLSSEVLALSAHVVLLGHPTLEEAQRVGDAVKTALAGRFSIAHATLDPECETCVSGDTPPCAMDALSLPGLTGAGAHHHH